VEEKGAGAAEWEIVRQKKLQQKWYAVVICTVMPCMSCDVHCDVPPNSSRLLYLFHAEFVSGTAVLRKYSSFSVYYQDAV
jgi:hypothetical protein